MPKITKRVVDGLRPDRNGKELFEWDAGDGALKGFGIRIEAERRSLLFGPVPEQRRAGPVAS